jgi:vitamin B12 transporter
MPFSRIFQIGILSSFLCASAWAQAQSQISGMVVDPRHEAVPRSTVQLLAADGIEIARTLSDQQGKFSFQQRCDSGCSVEIELEGFETKKVSLPLAQPEITLTVAPVREEINVTANLTETPTGQIGSSVTDLNAKDIADRQTLAFGDLLQTVPGAVVNRSGGLGSVTSLFIRGGESDYTKLLVDGIPINEPGGTFDFSSFAADGVSRVEIVRGPQSALFGSDAMTGVVQIFTKRGSSEDSKPHLNLDFDAGKYNTFHGGMGVGGQVKNFDYEGNWSRIDTDNQGPNADFRDSTGGANFGLALGDKTQIRLILRGDASNVGTPGQTAFEPADPGARSNRADGYAGFSINNHTTDEWNQRISYTYDRSRQVSRADLFPSDFVDDTRRQHLDYQSDVTLGSGDRSFGQHIFTFAFGWDRENGFLGDDASNFSLPTHSPLRNNFGGTFQHQAVLGRLIISSGVRVEDNGSFGRAVIPRSSIAYLLRHGSPGVWGATKLKFNFGLGIKEPTLVQSFSPDTGFLGNPNLRPERTRSFDFGVEQRVFNDRAKVEINWFDNRFRDIIEFVALPPIPSNPFPGTFDNVNQAKAKGAELIVETAPVHGLHINLNYSYVNSEIVASESLPPSITAPGNGLVRRPRHSGSLVLIWDWRKSTLSSTNTYVGRRTDSDFLGLGLTSSSPYSKWDLAWSYHITRQISYVAVFENVLDRSYQEALGFPALRATYRTGLKIRF